MGILTFFKGLESSFFLSRRERDGIVRSLSVPSRPLSGQGQSDTLEKCIPTLSQGERGMGRLSHFQFPHFLSQYESIYRSLKEREGWDGSVTFSSLTFSLNTRAFTALSRRERDGTAQSHSVPSPPFGLRPEAVILDRAVFASLSRGQSNPLRGFSSTIISLETKSEALRLRFLFQRRERDSNPRSCDRLRISRPAHSTTLASLRGLHNIV